MGEHFEGIVCSADVDSLQRALDGTVASLPARGRRAQFGIADLLPDLSVLHVRNARQEGSFLDVLAELGPTLSRGVDQAMVVAYDTRTGTRIAVLFERGELRAEFGEEDELWVALDEKGEAIAGSDQLRLDELLPECEYETVWNAVQLGLREMGKLEAWPILRQAISRL